MESYISIISIVRISKEIGLATNMLGGYFSGNALLEPS